MRATVTVLGRRFGAAGVWVFQQTGALRRPAFTACLAGGLLAWFGLAVLTQMVATLDVGYGVRWGWSLAFLLGLPWGARLTRQGTAGSPLGQVLLFAAVLGLWPTYLSLMLDGLTWLPLSTWEHPASKVFAGIVFGVLAATIPVALGTRWARTFAAASEMTGRPASTQSISFALGVGFGLVVLGLGFAPTWGVVVPTWIALMGFAVWAVVCPPPIQAANPTSQPTTTSQPASWELLGYGLVAGGVGQGAWSLMTEVVPMSLPLWSGAAAVLALGWSLGMGLSGWNRAPRLSRGVGLLWAAVIPWCLSAALIETSLALTSRLVVPIWLETARWGLLAALVGPVAVWWGGEARRVGHSRSFLLWTLPALGGWCLAELSQAWWSDPVPRLGGLGFVTLMLAVRDSWRRSAESRVGTWTRFAFPAGAFVVALGVVPYAWPVTTAVKLLYSTPALIAARTEWPHELLTQLDDIRPITQVAGPEGRWTVWGMRGGEIHVRCQGIPRGALSIQPAWSPQYPADVMSSILPLSLVDHPARVLVLGAGSGAPLQAALAFPISEVVCCEDDPALVGLIRGELAQRSGFDPFADERCRHLDLPASWLTLPHHERFDVITSAPPPAALPQSVSSLTVEFYARAAARLTPTGVFCQRISAVDFGPRPLLTAATSLAEAFPASLCLEVSAGEYLLLGAHDPAALVPADLPRRLELPHVAEILSRCGWDWSLVLNLPAYDRAALAEAAAELRMSPQSAGRAWLGYFAPRELLRWAPKLQETANLLGQPRSSEPAFPLVAMPPSPLAVVKNTTRRGRLLEWIGPEGDDPALLRRLSELASRDQLIRQFPDTYWWEYRKELREQLKDRPRTAVYGVPAVTKTSESRWHPEDRRRKAYFEALGAAVQADVPTAAQLGAIEAQLEPYDPMLTLFAHQELADLYQRHAAAPLRESAHRLHVIYYAPTGDASVRNVLAAIDHLVKDPGAAVSERDRFDQLNSLLQTLRGRWEVRQARPQKSAKVTLQEIERSLLSVERALDTLATLATTAGFTEPEWSARRSVLDRLLVRPFRGYRDQLVVHTKESQRKTRELLERANSPDPAAVLPSAN